MPNCSEEFFIINKIKNTLPWTYIINDLNGEEHFMKKNCKRLIKKNLELKNHLENFKFNKRRY